MSEPHGPAAGALRSGGRVHGSTASPFASPGGSPRRAQLWISGRPSRPPDCRKHNDAPTTRPPLGPLLTNTHFPIKPLGPQDSFLWGQRSRSKPIARGAARLQQQYVSVIEVGDAYAVRFRSLLKFLNVKTLIVTDIDSVDPSQKKRLGCHPAPRCHLITQQSPGPRCAIRRQEGGRVVVGQPDGPAA
ncbi:TOPRIM nucleotidyl transferase/hydrolase domain-containing protein [Streptomyces sp. ME18-1-4]|uniref:TOPRIM nucleotidyl transferase/hydrolase domain-containing protein n=1 Tax=Streptomyces sp. ME18-1-4 TaxID=3028685 RepID=UPI0029CA5A62|nr:TOPRIM nucleotidyl transferase/hydrolase domain-containing protein [Streptomyces sp. ME18-1-4]